MPKLLFFITEDWWFCRHFLPMAKAACNAGFDVAVATRVRNHGEEIAALGYRVLPLENERRSLSPWDAVSTTARMVRMVRTERPDVIHCIGLRMVLLGGLAAKLARVKALILAPTGLGHLWVANGLVERMLRPIIRSVICRVLDGPRARFLFENADDPRELGLDPTSGRVVLIGGAGVDPNEFPQTAEPAAPPLKVAVVARMLKPKGIAESVAAVRRAREIGVDAELHLFGATDPSNRTSLSEDELRAWTKEERGIFWHGSVADVARVWREHHVAMLLSWREGLPRSLVEAAASARPIIATDVTGCRDVVRDGIEGLLVPLGNVEATAKAIVRLAKDAGLRSRLGTAAHLRFLEQFTQAAVMKRATALYEEVRAAADKRLSRS